MTWILIMATALASSGSQTGWTLAANNDILMEFLCKKIPSKPKNNSVGSWDSYEPCIYEDFVIYVDKKPHKFKLKDVMAKALDDIKRSGVKEIEK